MKPETASDPTRTDALATPRVALDEIDSTNTEAARRAQRGEAGPLWITTRRQTHGKGRSGRSFESPASGNLYATLLLNIAAPALVLPQISLLAGVAAHDAVAAICRGKPPSGLRLKWPNDLLIDDAKLAGILAETVALDPAGASTVIIGWGFNVASHPTGLDRPATSLTAHGMAATADDLLVALDRAVFRWLDVWAHGSGFASVRATWLERAGKVGERLVVNRDDRAFEGVFMGLDWDGALLLADGSGQPQRITYGDVTLCDPIRRAEGASHP
jgi:BirA family biotin operon repressor/biotin-[acetyl-CoA-carboxylase] ligase